MKLVVAARDRLRAELRGHSLIKQHVRKLDEIGRLPKEELLALARKLEIDVAAIVADVAKNGRGMECHYEEDQLRTYHHCEEWPGFAGTFERSWSGRAV